MSTAARVLIRDHKGHDKAFEEIVGGVVFDK
jgi:hypothetical protein